MSQPQIVWTSPVWDYVDWPFEWDASEGGPGVAPSWKVAYEDWLARLADDAGGPIDPESALGGLVESLLGDVEDAVEKLAEE